MVKRAVVEPVIFVAVTVGVNVPSSIGVPEMTPVLVLRETPLGSLVIPAVVIE